MTKPNPSPAENRRQALRTVDATGSLDGVHVVMARRFQAKGYIRKEGGRVTLTKMGKAVMEGRIGKAGRGAVDMGSARHKAERGWDGRRRKATGSSMAAHMTGDGTTTRKRIERDERAFFESEGDRLKAEWDKEQAAHRAAVKRILGPQGVVSAVKIARADGTPFHRAELEALQTAGWEIHPGGTIAAQVGKALKGVRQSEFNPADALEKALGPESETRAVVLVAQGITEETLHQLRGAGYDLSSAPKRVREGSSVKTTPTNTTGHKRPRAATPPAQAKQAGTMTKAKPKKAMKKSAPKAAKNPAESPRTKAKRERKYSVAREKAYRDLLEIQKEIEERKRAFPGRVNPEKPKKPAAIGPDKVQPLNTKAAMKHRLVTELDKLLKGKAAPAKGKAKAKKTTFTPEKFTLTGRFNPTAAGDLARVWSAWTGTDPDQTLTFDVENHSVLLKTGGRVTIPENVVVLGRVAKFITKGGRLADFGTNGPLMVTDAKAERIWLLAEKPFHFDLEPSVIAYLARKPKFGDRGTIEYVHGFKGRVRAVMAGQIGAMTGAYRITPRGLED